MGGFEPLPSPDLRRLELPIAPNFPLCNDSPWPKAQGDG